MERSRAVGMSSQPDPQLSYLLSSRVSVVFRTCDVAERRENWKDCARLGRR